MYSLLLLCLIAFGSFTSADRDEDLYDLVNIKEILDNPEMTEAAFQCLMDRAPCGKYQVIRDKLPHLVQTSCNACNPEHKAKFIAYMGQYQREHNDQFNQMVAKFLAE